MKYFVSVVSLMIFLSACQPSSDQAKERPVSPREQVRLAKQLDEILVGEHRSAENKARDVYRNPKKTLEFFDVKPGMRVIEITPGSGWYSEILAPWLKEKDQYVAAIFDPKLAANERASAYYEKSNESLRQKFRDSPDIYGKAMLYSFDDDNPKFGKENSADRVLTFRNVHNWTNAGNDAAMFKGFYDVLKPGGVLGVVEHRASPGTDAATSAKSGYITEDYIIGLASQAGLQLEARVEINANPKDTKDYEQGVWTLPPSLRLGEVDKEKYLAIGESDRMTLKFVKPAAAASAEENPAAEKPVQKSSFEAKEDEAKNPAE